MKAVGPVLVLAWALCGCASTISGPAGSFDCPPTSGQLDGGEAKGIGDLDGDGRIDHEFPTHPISDHYRLICLSNDGSPMFYVVCGGWYVGRCPFENGQDRREWTGSKFHGSSTDGGRDDDGDGKVDSIEYEYDPKTGKVTIVIREDGVNVTRDGAYVIDAPPTPAGLPMPSAVPHSP